MSFWTVPRSARSRHALLLGDELVQEQQQRGRGVDRHRGRDLAERDAVEEDPHVLEGVDRDAGPPDLAGRARVVGVVAELRRQVERDREPRLPALEQVAEPRVRLLGRGEARVLANRPRPAPVHVGVRPARVRELARQLQLVAGVVRRVDRLELDARVGLALLRARHALIVRPGGFGEVSAEPQGRAARPDAASSVAAVFMNTAAPCVLASERASHPCDEWHSAKPS